MLNEEKIRLMTAAAMFEKKSRKTFAPASRQFKSDYIASHLIRSFITYTLTCLLLMLLWLLYRLESILDTMDIELLFSMAKWAGAVYLAGLVLYLAITWWVYAQRYAVSSLSLRVYQAKLKRMEKRYETAKDSEGVRRR